MTGAGPHAPELLHYYRGRVALHAILRGLGVTRGDEVVVTAYTCAAVVEPLRRIGAVPVFVDIDRRTCTADLDRLAEALSPRTRAVVVQHTFGTPVDLKRTLEFTEPAGVPVVEDCAHVTSGPARESLGTAGVAAFFSYEWGKPVVAGVGGLAVVNDPALAGRMRTAYANYTAPPAVRELMMAGQYAAHRVADRTGVVHRLRGLYRRMSGAGLIVGSYAEDPDLSPEYGWRMSRTVRGRLARRIRLAQAEVEPRRRLAERYRAELGLPATGGPVPIRLALAVEDKPAALRAAAAAGVELGDWFTTPVHPLAGDDLAAAGYRPGSCPNAEWAARHVVTVPIRAGVSAAEAGRALRLLTRLRERGDA